MSFLRGNPKCPKYGLSKGCSHDCHKFTVFWVLQNWGLEWEGFVYCRNSSRYKSGLNRRRVFYFTGWKDGRSYNNDAEPNPPLRHCHAGYTESCDQLSGWLLSAQLDGTYTWYIHFLYNSCAPHCVHRFAQLKCTYKEEYAKYGVQCVICLHIMSNKSQFIEAREWKIVITALCKLVAMACWGK